MRAHADHDLCRARTRDGTVLYQHQREPYPALDPRVAYMMVSMMQEVLRSGTGAAARSLGFCPSRRWQDRNLARWLVCGFHESELLCVVWVGFDDNREFEPGRRGVRPCRYGPSL